MALNSGNVTGGDIVYVFGTGFVSTSQVLIGGKNAPIVSYISSTEMSVQVPAGDAIGSVDVTVINTDGQQVTLSGGYTYIAPLTADPEITSVTPNTGVITGGNQVYVNGKNFKTGMTIFVGGKQASTTYVSTTKFMITVPAGDNVGAVDVAVADLNNKFFTLATAYTYTAVQYPIPTITSIVPNTGLVAGGETIYVNGTNFVNGISQVTIGGKPASTTYMSRTSLMVIVPAGDAPGKVDVKVTNVTNEVVLTQGYEYTLPAIKPVTVTTVSPNQGKVMGGDIVYIYGTNFMSGATVTFGSNIASSTYVNATTIKATVPAGTVVGKVDVTVTNPDGGTGTLPQGYLYTVVTPTITSLSPNHGNKAGGDVIYVNGTNFESGANVTINGVNASVTFMNSTSLKVTVPSSPTIGDVPLVVTLSNGQSASATFTYDNGPVLPAPKITSMSPTTSPVGSLVYVNGLNFASTSKVYFGGVQATAVYMNSKSLKVTVPSGSGVVNVTVVNADGQTSNALTFTIN
ncbi:IPT/TIG domain-containing protein [Paenibacillus sp. Soil787]|uniref:IPT/TIG domain-containing protein n=1 Tax=Paenibacillus sp. Soil787 TaxID=1736411 RepID=UPI00190FC7CF|nr:IPT/TIG domain-containing protein [Paenibacillus sp. Soil787]